MLHVTITVNGQSVTEDVDSEKITNTLLSVLNLNSKTADKNLREAELYVKSLKVAGEKQGVKPKDVVIVVENSTDSTTTSATSNLSAWESLIALQRQFDVEKAYFGAPRGRGAGEKKENKAPNMLENLFT